MSSFSHVTTSYDLALPSGRMVRAELELTDWKEISLLRSATIATATATRETTSNAGILLRCWVMFGLVTLGIVLVTK
jgi:hypothetical protein